MNEELRERRRKTWRLLIAKGLEYRQVVEKIASDFGVQEGTIEKDIERMGDWVGKLARVDDDHGVSRLLELRENRKRLQRMATKAAKDGDTRRELRIRRKIDKNIEMDIEISQSLGATYEKPDKVEQTIRTEETESESYEIITDDEGIDAPPEAVEAAVEQAVEGKDDE